MSSSVSNLRLGMLSRSSYFIGGALASVLALSGVVVLPAVKSEDAHELLQLAEQRANRFAELQTKLEAARQSGEIESLDEAFARLRDYLPAAPAEIELHSAIRLAANAGGVELEAVSIGEVRDLHLPLLDRDIYAKGVHCSGVTTMPNIVRFVESLEDLGYPCAVSDFSFARETASDRDFSFRLSLDTFHAGDKLAAVATDGSLPDEEMP